MITAVEVESEPSPDPLDWLRSRVELTQLIAWGWNPDTRVWNIDPANDLFAYRACVVEDCDFPTDRREGLCRGCRWRWQAAGVALEDFAAQPVDRERWRTERLCRVCREPGHQRPVATHGLCVACDGLRRHRHQDVETYVTGDEQFRPATPRATIGGCAAVTCERLAAHKIGLCAGHYTKWCKSGRPALAEWCATVGSLLGDGGTRIAVGGVPERFVVEFLYAVQTAIAHGRKLRPTDLRTVLDWARRQQCESFADLQVGAANAEAARFVVHAIDAVALAHKTPESEFGTDVWDLRVWGFKGRLSFVGGQPVRHRGHTAAEPIRQRWLRETAKSWAASRLPLVRTPVDAQAVVATIGRWSAHLARRSDGGDNPATLDKADVDSFLIALRVLTEQGELHPYMHRKNVASLRRFLREIRDLELDGWTGPGFGLRRSVTVTREEVPPMPRRDPDDEIGDSIPNAVLVQLLDDANVARLAPDARRRFEIGLEIGRRPSELCQLRLDCLTHDERLNDLTGETEAKPVLVYDMTKIGMLRCRLPIHEQTAELIRQQQDEVRARFPDTPRGELALFPAVQRPQGGRRSLSASSWGLELRRWVEQLDLCEGWLDAENGIHPRVDATGQPVRFDASRLFPYALRHTYAQRHVNAGTPVEVLKELMGHAKLDTTSGYYRISAKRKREAVKRVLPLQMTAAGARLRIASAATDADVAPYVLSQIAVPMGSCTEPSNVRARGGACDFRYRCFGCSHFRTDPSYLHELRSYLTQLLTARERLAAALPEIADWARQEASPSDGEISTVRRLITTCETALADLDPEDRAATETAIEMMRTTRATMDTTFPVQFRGVVAQESPVFFPNVMIDAGG